MPQESRGAPFVETTVAKHMLSRMELTHGERGIMVASGPWGIGKTTAIDAFAAKYEESCVVVKVEPGPTAGKGASPSKMMQLAIEALRQLRGSNTSSQLGRSAWRLRQMINECLSWHFGPEEWRVGENPPPFTFIFDEAQYLSRDAIDALRFWNDPDRTTTPFPVGLIFVGNNEFAMEETLGGESVLSGAVRSRLLFELALSYEHLADTDLTLFAQSMGITEADALREFVAYFHQPRIKRDLRLAKRLLNVCLRDAPDGRVGAETIRRVFGILS